MISNHIQLKNDGKNLSVFIKVIRDFTPEKKVIFFISFKVVQTILY